MVLTSNASPILQHSDDAKEARRAFVEAAADLQGRVATADSARTRRSP